MAHLLKVVEYAAFAALVIASRTSVLRVAKIATIIAIWPVVARSRLRSVAQERSMSVGPRRPIVSKVAAMMIAVYLK